LFSFSLVSLTPPFELAYCCVKIVQMYPEEFPFCYWDYYFVADCGCHCDSDADKLFHLTPVFSLGLSSLPLLWWVVDWYNLHGLPLLIKAGCLFSVCFYAVVRGLCLVLHTPGNINFYFRNILLFRGNWRSKDSLKYQLFYSFISLLMSIYFFFPSINFMLFCF